MGSWEAPSRDLCFPVSTHPHKAGLCPIEAEEIKLVNYKSEDLQPFLNTVSLHDY